MYLWGGLFEFKKNTALLISRVGCCFALSNRVFGNGMAYLYLASCQVFVALSALYNNELTFGEGKHAMKTANQLLALSALATGALFTTSTFACSTLAWASALGTTAGSPTAVARVVGKCGLEVSGTGVVVDNTPLAEAAFIARFYFFGKNIGAGVHDIFQARTADGIGGTQVFKITYDGTDIGVNATGAGGTTASAAALPNKWNLIEVSWAADGAGSLWVNADARSDPASASFTSGTGSVGSATLGAVSDISTNKALFDDYVSHHTLPVGPPLIGDGNDDTLIDAGDINAVVAEFLSGTLANGQPDCNLDGLVDAGDINCVVGIFLGTP